MKLRALILLACMAPVVLAEGLPDLGEQSQVDFSPAVEKRTGEAIMRLLMSATRKSMAT